MTSVLRTRRLRRASVVAARPLLTAALLSGTMLVAAAPAHADVVYNGDTFINFNNSGVGDVYVGDGTYGHLTLGGSAVLNYGGNAYVGRAGETPDGLVNMTTGSQWIVGGDLYLGQNGGKGAVTVGDGASLNVGSGLGSILLDGTSTLNIGNGTVSAFRVDVGTNSIVNLNHSSPNYVFGPVFSGDGTINQIAGTTTLFGDNSDFVGQVNVVGGSLLVEGLIGKNNQVSLTVGSGGTLGGSGTIVGQVNVEDGGILSPGGSSVGTLNLVALNLSAGSILNFDLGPQGVVGEGSNDLIVVNGDVSLDGTINITDVGNFGGGVYRLIDYAGGLSDFGLEIGSVPDGFTAADLSIDTSTGGQVNLINSAGLTLSFWDGGAAGNFENGVVDGGSGTWTATSPTWTNVAGTDNGALEAPPGLAVFSGTAGTVTADASAGALSVNAMQFFTSGYRIQGDPITLANSSTTIRVGDGTAASASTTATIASSLVGLNGLEKTDYGRLILAGNNSYTGDTTVSAGTLELQGGHAIADTGVVILADVAGANLLVTNSEEIGTLFGGGTNGGNVSIASGQTLTTGSFSNTIYSGVISGAGGLTKVGATTLTLAGSNTYTGATTISAGTLKAGAAGAFASNSAFTVNGTADLGGFNQTIASLSGSGNVRNTSGSARLTIGGTASTTFSGSMANGGGTFALTKSGSGTLTLTGTSTYTGTTQVTGGTLKVDGRLTNSSVTLSNATLAGIGTIDQTLTVGNGTLAPGAIGSVGTINIGNLVMGSTSKLAMDLGAPGVPGASDLVNVTGDVTLDGTLNITNAGSFGAGVYRLIDYAGGIVDNGLLIGTTGGAASADLSIQTAVDQQVNLVNSTGLTLNFWDGQDPANWNNGSVDGGSGIWTTTDIGWTDSNGLVTAKMKPVPTFAVFQGNAGTVNVLGSYDAFFNFTPVQTAGMQFAVDGYMIQGDALLFNGASTTFRVGDGTAAGANYKATLDIQLAGSGGLVKTDLGTLILKHDNSYSGGTTIQSGTIRVETNNALSGGTVTAQGGTLDYGSGRTISNPIALAANFNLNQTGGSATQSGAISGSFGITKTGTGTLTLSGANSYTGTTTVSGGTLQAGGGAAIANTGLVSISSDATFGLLNDEGIGGLAGAGNVTLGANTLAVGGNFDSLFSGTIGGTGNVVKSGTGTLTLAGANTYSGFTDVTQGRVLVDGSIAGNASAEWGGILGGSGSIGGAVDIQAGGILAGVQGQTLTMGSLALASSATVEATLGAADGADTLFDVSGNLTLDGSLNVVDAGSFGAGVYRLFDYGGTLTNNGLDIGSTPSGVSASDLLVQTSVVGQVNLISTTGVDLLFWDGANAALFDNGVVNGGTGAWNASDRTFTTADGSVNGAYRPRPGFVVFEGTPGSVTVDNGLGSISVTGIQFATDGYMFMGDPLTLADPDGTATIRVGDGTLAGGGYSAFIFTELTGANGLDKTDLGTLVLGSDNSYSGGTTVSGGILQIGAGGSNGSVVGNIVDNSAVSFVRDDSYTYSGVISGTGSVSQIGTGTLILTGTNSYTGNTAASSGTLQIGNGGTTGSIAGNASVNATLAFNRFDAITYSGVISGNGTLRQLGSSLTLTGNSSNFGGSTFVDAGTLRVNGSLGKSSSTLSVASGAALAGSGKVGGAVTVANGGTLAGVQGSTLTLGSLVLNSGSTISAALGEPATSPALFDVTGNLTLDGTLDVLDAGQFGAGVYRLFDYGGALTDNGLAFGTTPGGVTSDDLLVQTSIAGQVNLISTAGADLLFWDGGNAALYDNGVVNGGTGTWRTGDRTFTTADGAVNGSMTPVPGFVVFQGTPGTVTVDDSAGDVSVIGMQFAAGGYTVQGDAIGLDNATGTSTVRVGDGTSAGAAYTATIASVLSGTDTLQKSDLGTLILTGANSYSGGTVVAAGTLQIGNGGTAGSIAGDATTNATLAFDRSDTVTFAGNIDGTGALKQIGSGALILTGAATHSGGTTVQAGTLQIGNGGTTGSLSGNVTDNAALVFDRSDTITYAGAVSGTGSLTQTGSGALILTGANAYSGGTIISAGTLQIGNGGTAGSVAGNIVDNGALAFDRSDALTYAGAISGNGTLTQLAGTLTLTGDSSSFGGSTTVSGGTLNVNGSLGTSATTLTVASGATLSGTGNVGGSVSVNAGGTLAGTQGSTLTLASLDLSPDAAVNVALGAADDAAALFDVTGNLTLDGTLNVTDLGGFGAGLYRLFDYGGTLTDNGLAVGSVPGGYTAGDLAVQTSVAGQVNLLNSNDQELLFWDGSNAADWNNGAVDGGAGTWSASEHSWTDASGLVNGPMKPVPGFAIFTGTGGTVTVDGTPDEIAVTGMQFASDGYSITGDAIALPGTEAIVRVGDGTAAGADYTATISSALTGSAKLVKTDLGTLILTGANSYTGGTEVVGGTLVGTSSSIKGDVLNNATLVFDQDAEGSFGGAISGGGSSVKRGAGILTLAGANGTDWSVEEGGLVSTTSLFTGDLTISDGASFTFDQDVDGTYAGSVTGAGQLLFDGTGLVKLTGDSSGRTGTTTVNDGTLSVNGKLGGTVMVGTDGRLQGTGTVGSVTVVGTIAPGNSIGTLHVAGDISFTPSADYEVELNDLGQSDLIDATGKATIQGGSVISLASGSHFAPLTDYLILDADGGVTGTFDHVTSNLAFLDPTLLYGTNSVTLRMMRNDISFASAGQTGNQKATAAALESLGFGNAIYNRILVLSDTDARTAFDALSGEGHATLRSSLLEDSRFIRDAMLSHAADGGQGVTAWGHVTGSWADADGSANAAGYKRSLEGFATGIDAGLGETLRIGAAFGYDTRDLHTQRAFNADIDTVHLGLNGGATVGGFSVDVGAAYAWHDLKTRRDVVFTGLSESETANYHAHSFQAFGEIAWKMDAKALQLQPFARIAHVEVSSGDFRETGGIAAAIGGDRNSKASFASLGLRAAGGLVTSSPISFRGSAAVRFAIDGRHPGADMSVGGSDPFLVEGTPLQKTALDLDLGFDAKLSKRLTLGLGYTGQHGSNYNDSGARASLSLKW